MQNSKKMVRIYLGPSLPVSEAKEILEADYQPPIKRGDLDKIKNPKNYIVGIIDGAFHQSLAVSVVEVRQFIEDGGSIFGASSMGALRAVELKPLGMKGVGRIYQDYLSEKLNSDEDVALVFSPETGEALTIPTVQVKYAVEQAKKAGDLTPEAARKALSESKKIYYAERTLAMLLKVIGLKLKPEEVASLKKILTNPEMDPKRQDAIALLKVVKGCVS